MTMTVKLDAALEQRLRQRCAALDVPASQVIREALVQWLDSMPEPAPSAHALGEDLFGRHAGPADLASQRKAALADVWADKAGRPSRGTRGARSQRPGASGA